MAIVNRRCLYVLFVVGWLQMYVNGENATEITTREGNIPENSTQLDNSTSSTLLPDGWDKFCVPSGGDGAGPSFKCLIDKESSGKWNFNVLRLWISFLDVPFSFSIECIDGTNISLPWPVKAKNLVYVKVENCAVVDYFGDYGNKLISQFPDQLRILDLSDVHIIINVNDLLSIASNIANISKDYDCGNEDTIEHSVMRNITYGFGEELLHMMTGDNSSTGGDSDPIISAGSSLVHQTRKIPHKCIFKELRTLDHSISNSKSKYFSELSTVNSFYPKLRSYNLSHTGISEISAEFKNWWNFFDKLQVLDLSHNFIPGLDFDPSTGAWRGVTQNLTLDLRFNNITAFDIDDIELLILKTPNLFIDFSQNPLQCACNKQTKDLMNLVHDSAVWKKEEFQRYSFIQQMECDTPLYLKGRQLINLFESDLPCKYNEVFKYALGPIIGLSLLALFLLIIIILLTKFRREVIILVYTRFNIVLPCQPEETLENKEFDAFVAYSSADQDWVTEVFDSGNEHLKGFKFCLHYKHFIAGNTIFDNVIHSVEASRHTIIVLSREFVKSNYCMYEFHEAFQQSIIERKRHLITIMMEDIPMDELPADLKRCIKTFTFIKKDDLIFNDRLVYAMSYKGRKLAPYSRSANNGTSVSSWNTDVTTVSPSVISTDSVFTDTIFKEKNNIFQTPIPHEELTKQKNKENLNSESYNVV